MVKGRTVVEWYIQPNSNPIGFKNWIPLGPGLGKIARPSYQKTFFLIRIKLYIYN